MKYLLLFAAVSLLVVPTGEKVHADTIVQGWQFDLSAVSGQGLTGVISPIDEFNYRAITHYETIDTNQNGSADRGEFLVLDAVGAAIAFTGNGMFQNNSSTGEVLNRDYELTFDFSAGAVGTSSNGAFSVFHHTAAGVPAGIDGLLHLYIDGNPNAELNFGVGGNAVDGISDGTLVATFQVLAGAGGGISRGTLDGSHNTDFELVSAAPGVFLDLMGNDLGLLTAGGERVLISAFRLSFDLDHDGNGLIDSGPPSGWPFPRVGTGSPVDFFALSDGTVNLHVVPEAGSLLSFAAVSLFAMGVRRKRRKT